MIDLSVSKILDFMNFDYLFFSPLSIGGEKSRDVDRSDNRILPYCLRPVVGAGGIWARTVAMLGSANFARLHRSVAVGVPLWAPPLHWFRGGATSGVLVPHDLYMYSS